MKFEFLVAVRYLKAKRKQAVISLITVISVIGVAAGVAALIIALAINAGFREDLQKKLLGAAGTHFTVAEKESREFADYMQVAKQVEQDSRSRCRCAGRLSERSCFRAESSNEGVFMKGIIPEMESRMSALSENIVEGSLKDFDDDSIIIGKELANVARNVQGRSREGHQRRDDD